MSAIISLYICLAGCFFLNNLFKKFIFILILLPTYRLEKPWQILIPECSHVTTQKVSLFQTFIICICSVQLGCHWLMEVSLHKATFCYILNAIPIFDTLRKLRQKVKERNTNKIKYQIKEILY